jgi:hypothetical protein
MSINWLVFSLVTISQVVIGALWFSFLFKDIWLKINHPDKLPSESEMKELGKQAGPAFVIQLVIQIISNVCL